MVNSVYLCGTKREHEKILLDRTDSDNRFRLQNPEALL